MKASFSPLEIQGFTVMEFDLKTVFPESDSKEQIEFELDLSKLPVDLDYDHIQEPDEEGFRVMMTVKVNRSKDQLNGYAFKMVCFGTFKLRDQEKLNDQEVGNLIMFSTVNIMISNVRGYLRDITSYSLFGSYILPSINMSKMIQLKMRKNKRKQ